MNFIILTVFTVLLALITTLVFKRPKKQRIAARSPYRSTSVAVGIGACCAVKSIESKRFLDVDRITPQLPLAECDVSTCNCKFVRHEDRRFNDDDRRQPGSLQSALYDRSGNDERRKNKRGRRSTDSSETTYGGRIAAPALTRNNLVSG